PTCSSYAIEAIEVHGVLRGSFMGLMRLLRCHPFHPGGYDPVPAKGARRAHQHEDETDAHEEAAHEEAVQKAVVHEEAAQKAAVHGEAVRNPAARQAAGPMRIETQASE